jgi:hypothetical protein
MTAKKVMLLELQLVKSILRQTQYNLTKSFDDEIFERKIKKKVKW